MSGPSRRLLLTEGLARTGPSMTTPGAAWGSFGGRWELPLLVLDGRGWVGDSLKSKSMFGFVLAIVTRGGQISTYIWERTTDNMLTTVASILITTGLNTLELLKYADYPRVKTC